MALVIAQKKVRSAIRIEVKKRPAIAASIVENKAVAEFGHEEYAIAFCFRVVEAEVHAAIVEHPDAPAFISRRIIKENAGGRAASLPPTRQLLIH